MIARRLVGRFGALVAGLVLALSPLLVEHSLKVTPDIFLTLFSALALWSFLDVYEKGRWRDYAMSALWIGLGAASKYTPVLLVPCLVAAHLSRSWSTERSGSVARWRALFDPRLVLAGVICAAAFFVASPYTVLSLGAAKRDVSSQFVHVVTAGHFGYEAGSSGYVVYLTNVLPGALGWPALIFGLVGLGLAARRRRGAWLIVLLYFVCFYAGLGARR
jgi:4-amino-4-deoxy-L-arabinose transferase-like glycosyltransferase